MRERISLLLASGLAVLMLVTCLLAIVGAIVFALADGWAKATAERAHSDLGPRWSPDGSLLAFTRIEGKQAFVYAMNSGGTEQIRIARGSARFPGLAWSPDGRRVAYARGPAVYVQRPDGTGTSTPARDPALVRAVRRKPAGRVRSPDGREVALVRQGRIWIVSTHGGEAERLT